MELSATAQGCALIETRRRIDQSEAEWLVELIEFDRSELWREDGHMGGASWLMERCGFSRATAFEKLRVCREMRRRPALRDALLEQRATYSQVRVISRITDGGDKFDELMLSQTKRLTADELEIAVTHWDRLRNQEEPPPPERRRIQRTRGFGGGMGRLIIDDWDENLDRLMNTLDASIDGNERAAAKTSKADAESPRETPLDPFDPSHLQNDEGDVPPPPSMSMKRLDALNDLLDIAVAVNPDTIDPDRAAIGVTIAYENLIAGIGVGALSRGGTISGEAARRLCCDAGVHRLVTKGQSEILDVGRQTRIWTTAMKRGIKAKFGNKCAIKGCCRRVVQIHHLIWWENGGTTSIELGVPLCHGHHVLVHEGKWTLDYNHETGQVRLTRPGYSTLVSYATFEGAAA